MGFAIQKLPLFKKLKVVNPKVGGGLLSKIDSKPKIMVKTYPKMIGTPLWARDKPDYTTVAYDMQRQDPGVVVVEYKPIDLSEDQYSRIYLVGPDGNPVPYMTGIWDELRSKAKAQSAFFSGGYNIDSEGRITERGSLVKASESWPIIKEAVNIHNQWKRFPKAKDYDTVCKLYEGQLAIDRLNSEDKYKRIDSQIKAAQESIKAEQEMIAKLEKALNNIYENAADAMNLFEENGIEPNMEGDGEPKRQPPITSLDVSSLYPNSLFNQTPINHTPICRFIGNASILASTTGECRVAFANDPGSIQVGDMVADPITRRQAVYCDNNEWALIA